MKKKLYATILAVCFVPMVALTLVACGGISEKEIYDKYANAINSLLNIDSNLTANIETIEEIHNGINCEKNVNIDSFTYDKQSNLALHKTQSFSSHNQSTDDVSSITNNRIVVYDEENGYQYYKFNALSQTPEESLLVGDDYAKSLVIEYNFYNIVNKILFQESYDNIKNPSQINKSKYIQKYIHEIAADYSNFNVISSFEELKDNKFKANFEVVYDFGYKSEGLVNKYNVSEKYAYEYNENFVYSINLTTSYNLSVYSDTITPILLAEENNNSSLTATFEKSFNEDLYDSVDVSNFEIPTQKAQALLSVYLDGEEVLLKHYDFDNKIVTIIENDIDPMEHTTFEAFYDKKCSIPVDENTLMSSYSPVVIYLKSIPEENYAWISLSYYYSDGKLIETLSPTVLPSNNLYKFSALYNGTTSPLTYIDCSDKVLINNAITDKYEIQLESKTRYIINCYSAISDDQMKEISVKISFLGSSQQPTELTTNLSQGANIMAIIEDIVKNQYSSYEIDHIFSVDVNDEETIVNKSTVVNSSIKSIHLYLQKNN